MEKPILKEHFRGPTLEPRLRWLNPPASWRLSPRGLVVRPKAKTDFWQKTHYGFRTDNGHFLYIEIEGDFSLSTRVHFRPVHLYDQAGLMVRVGPDCWIKTSVEYETRGPARLGAVVTNNGQSDWSLQNFPRNRRTVRLRIRRSARDFLVEWGAGTDSNWELLRVAHLHQGTGQPIQCGLYACCPKGAGYVATFEYLQLVRVSAGR